MLALIVVAVAIAGVQMFPSPHGSELSSAASDYSVNLGDTTTFAGVPGVTLGPSTIIFDNAANGYSYEISGTGSYSISFNTDVTTTVTFNDMSLRGQITLNGNANVTMLLSGVNTITGSIYGTSTTTIKIDSADSTVAIPNSTNGSLTVSGAPAGYAGIGGGGAVGLREAGIITINGGTINVTGGQSSAGIGSGGPGGTCGTITINGGNITATGGQSGAGIGGGANSLGGGTINIIAGKVTTFGNNAAGIGGGSQGAGVAIAIGSAADVTAFSSNANYGGFNINGTTASGWYVNTVFSGTLPTTGIILAVFEKSTGIKVYDITLPVGYHAFAFHVPGCESLTNYNIFMENSAGTWVVTRASGTNAGSPDIYTVNGINGYLSDGAALTGANTGCLPITLSPAYAVRVTFAGNGTVAATSNGSLFGSPVTGTDGETKTLYSFTDSTEISFSATASSPFVFDHFDIDGTTTTDNPSVNNPISGDMAVTAAFGIKYMDVDGNSKTQIGGVKELTNDYFTPTSDPYVLTAGWYYVGTDVTIPSNNTPTNDRLLIVGDVNIIIADDCTLQVDCNPSGGGAIQTTGGDLSFYSQPALHNGVLKITNAGGISFNGNNSTFTNTADIKGEVTILTLNLLNEVSVYNGVTGKFTGSPDGISNSNGISVVGRNTTIYNYGSISGSGTGNGIQISASGCTVNNFAGVAGEEYGGWAPIMDWAATITGASGVYFGNGVSSGTIINYSEITGTAIGTTTTGGIFSVNAKITVDNYGGTIKGESNGIYLNAGGSVWNKGGIITGAINGLYLNSGSPGGYIENDGDIYASDNAGFGIYLAGASNIECYNYGTIGLNNPSEAYGINATARTGGVLVENYATIYGDVILPDYQNTVTFAVGSSIVGNFTMGMGADSTLTFSGILDSDLTYSTVTGISDIGDANVQVSFDYAGSGLSAPSYTGQDIILIDGSTISTGTVTGTPENTTFPTTDYTFYIITKGDNQLVASTGKVLTFTIVGDGKVDVYNAADSTILGTYYWVSTDLELSISPYVESVKLVATGENGYYFGSFALDGGTPNSVNPLTFSVPADMAITVTFYDSTTMAKVTLYPFPGTIAPTFTLTQSGSSVTGATGVGNEMVYAVVKDTLFTATSQATFGDYSFLGWYGKIEGADLTETVDSDTSFTAVYLDTTSQIKVTIDAYPTTLNPAFTVEQNSNDVPYVLLSAGNGRIFAVDMDADFEMTVPAVTDYIFMKWLDSKADDNPRTIAANTLSADKTYSAYFLTTVLGDQTILNATAVPTGSGTFTYTLFTIDQGAFTSGTTFNKSDVVTVKPVPAAGTSYVFSKWLDITSSADPRTPVLTGGGTVSMVAYFKSTDPNDLTTLNATAVPTGSGTFTYTLFTHTMGALTNGTTFNRVDEVTVTPNANTGNTFVKWVDNGSTTPLRSPDLTIGGTVTIIAQFSVPDQSGKVYYITATSDSGSTIAPYGTSTVQFGMDKLYTFSAKKGYLIDKIYVDGTAIQIDAASGTYTFTNVIYNHTIDVVSKTDDRTDDGGGTSDSGGGDVGGGSEANGNWAVMNLVCAVMALFAGVIALFAGRDRIEKDEKERGSKTALFLRVLVFIIGIVSLIIFFLTEDLSQSVTAFDSWTVLMFVLLVVALIIAFVSFRFDGREETK